MFFAPLRLILRVRGMAGGTSSGVTNFGISPPGSTEPDDPLARAGVDDPRTPVVSTTAPAAVSRKNVLLDSVKFVPVPVPIVLVIVLPHVRVIPERILEASPVVTLCEKTRTGRGPLVLIRRSRWPDGRPSRAADRVAVAF